MFEPLRHRNFRRLTAARTAGWLGNTIAPIALAFAVLDLTGSVSDLGIVVGARSIANVLLLLLGGVLADRLPRALLLQGASVVAAITEALLAASVLFGFASVPLLAAVGVVNGAVAAVSMPAAMAITPQTVPAGLLQQANAIVRMGTSTAAIVGASCGGLLVALLGPGAAMGATTGLFLVEAAWYFGVRIRRDEPAEPRPRSRPLADLREGWTEFVSRTWIWVVVAQFMVVNAANNGVVRVLGPKIADDTIGRTAWGLVLAAGMVGALGGGLLAARWQPRRALLFGVALTAVMAAPLVALAQAPVVPVLLTTGFLAGVAMEQFSVAWDVSVQENVPADRLARVYSYDIVGSVLAIPIGQLTVGPLATQIGIRATVLGAAALIVLATAAALLSRDVRTLARLDGRREEIVAALGR